jgi:hypothetical protein
MRASVGMVRYHVIHSARYLAGLPLCQLASFRPMASYMTQSGASIPLPLARASKSVAAEQICEIS